MKKILIGILIVTLFGLLLYFVMTSNVNQKKYSACTKGMNFMARTIENNPKAVLFIGIYQNGEKFIFISYEFIGEGKWQATEYIDNGNSYEQVGQKTFSPEYNEFMYYIYEGKHFEYVAGSKYYGNKIIFGACRTNLESGREL